MSDAGYGPHDQAEAGGSRMQGADVQGRGDIIEDGGGPYMPDPTNSQRYLEEMKNTKQVIRFERT